MAIDILCCASPVLRWAGGKVQLQDTILAAIARLHPGTIEHYYEPFCGGAAIFFALAAKKRFQRATLSDTNAELINTYLAIRDDVAGVIRELKKLVKRPYQEATYYEIRASEPRSLAARAARMIYLNKTNFNGLYRVNKKGKFNVPWGKRKSPLILDVVGLTAANAALQGVELIIDQYTYAAYVATPEDFVYYDCPYAPVKKTSFSAYQAAGFSKDDQIILSEHLRILAGKGVPALLSNSHCPVTVKLYQGLVKTRVLARRNINRNGAERGHVSEFLVEARFTSQQRKKNAA